MSARVAPLLCLLSLLLACSAFRCDGDTATVQPAPAKPRPDLRLLVLTDPKGYLEPCGCQSRPLGGVDKLATVATRARADGVPLVAVAAGDLTFGSVLRAEDADGARAQEVWRAETLVDAWSQIGLTAATPGPLDFSQGSAEQIALAQRSKFPWLVENVSGAPEGAVSKARVFDAGPVKVGIFGLIAPTPALTLPQGASLDPDLGGVGKRTAEALRAQGAKLVVALVVGDRRAAREVAGSGVDVVVMGGVELERPLAPSQHSGAVILTAGYQGQRTVLVDLELDGSGELRDVSAWTSSEARAELETRIRELRARIADWEKDPATKAQDLDAQRARLASLEAELQSKATPSYTGRWLSAEAIELAPEIAGEPSIANKIDAYDKRVNEHNKISLADRKPLPAPEGAAHYVGSESCKSCHQAAYDWWRNTKHGRAYATLERVHKEFNLSCVGCHVTGYNQPGGSTVTHVDNLKDVGCENCHGPGSKHNAAPEQPGLVAADTPEAVCVSCHNHEHSDRFVYGAFKSLLIVPGHGQPAHTN